MVTKIIEWFNTSCEFCLYVRRVMHGFVSIILDLIMLGLFALSGLFIWWVMFDTSPIMYYGPNGRVRITETAVIVNLDAVRLRDCPVTIKRKIIGCGQIDIPETIGVAKVGERVSDVVIPMSVIFPSGEKSDAAGNLCQLISIATGYCNPAQRLIDRPIITQSPPINFIISTGPAPED